MEEYKYEITRVCKKLKYKQGGCECCAYYRGGCNLEETLIEIEESHVKEQGYNEVIANIEDCLESYLDSEDISNTNDAINRSLNNDIARGFKLSLIHI